MKESLVVAGERDVAGTAVSDHVRHLVLIVAMMAFPHSNYIYPILFHFKDLYIYYLFIIILIIISYNKYKNKGFSNLNNVIITWF